MTVRVPKTITVSVNERLFSYPIYKITFIQRLRIYRICVFKHKKSLQGLKIGLSDGLPSTFPNIKMFMEI